VGVVVLSALLAAYCTVIFALSRKDKITADNVNDRWGEHGEAFEKPTETVRTGV
jgi:hypothetical protein